MITSSVNQLATVGTVDEKLLAEARQVQERLKHLEHEAEAARTEFRRAVHRLVSEGSRPQDVAAALGLSGQQLHQIVQQAGGSERRGRDTPTDAGLACTFCGKSQYEVRKLIAGPTVYICDGCVELCVDYIREEGTFDRIFSPLRPDQIGDPTSTVTSEVVPGVSREELENILERGKKGVARSRRALQFIERRLAMREGEDPRGDDLLAMPELAYLKNKSRDELLALQQTAQVQLKRYEEGLRIATSALAQRGQQTA